MTSSEVFVHVRLPDASTRLVGRYRLLRPAGQASLGEFAYVGSWLRNDDGRAFPLDPQNLPLLRGQVRVRTRAHLPGVLADATPDRWGRKVVLATRSVAPGDSVDWLLATGSDRVGCLCFSSTPDPPQEPQAYAEVSDLDEVARQFGRLERGESADPLAEQIFRAGRSLGGARPKAVVLMEGALWIAKFQRRDDDYDQCATEHATMLLAAACGCESAKTRLLDVGQRKVVLVRRFDREPAPALTPTGHYLSALSALGLDDASPGGSYPEIAGFLRRYGAQHLEDRRLLFRRMVFNVLCGNRDDHLKNHGFLYTPDGGWRLTPAFDIVPQPDIDPMQAIGVGRSGSYPSRDNCLSLCADFGLTASDAAPLFDEVRETMRDWPRRFASDGVDAATIARLRPAFSPMLA